VGDGEVNIAIDWKDLDKRLDNYELHALIQIIEMEMNKNTSTEHDYSFTICTCRVNAPKNSHNYYMNHFVSQLFLALNLATPGCCNFYTLSIKRIDDQDDYHHYRLSSDTFESAFCMSKQLSWPKMSTLPFSDTWSWLRSVIPTPQDIAYTRLEKAIFALFYVCQDNDLDPSILIWLAHAFEALFDTPKEDITKTLRERIALVLGNPNKQIMKTISEFYSKRSSFVHGSMEIAHPFANSVRNGEVEKLETDIRSAADFATSIVIAVLQMCVQNKWREINYAQTFTGVPL